MPKYGKLKKGLAQARKEGKDAAGGQLGTIADRANKNINKHLAAADKRTSRIIENMSQIQARSKAYGREQRFGVRAEQAHQLALGGAMSSGLTGRRSRTVDVAAETSADLMKASKKQGKKLKGAELGAISSLKKSEGAQNRASMSILDVLAAERKSEDWKFIAQMKHDERMTRLQITLPFKLEQKQAEKEQKKSQFYNFSTQMGAIEDGIQEVTSIINDPASLKLAQESYPALNATDAVAQYARDQVQAVTPGDDTELAAVNAAITATVENYMKGELAPTFNEVAELIGATSPEMQAYLSENPRLENLHNTYRAIRIAERENVAGGGVAKPTADQPTVDEAATKTALGSAATLAVGGFSSALLGAAYTAGRAGGASGAVNAVRAFFGKPGAFQNATSQALAKTGNVNPFASTLSDIAAGEGGAISRAVLADLGIITAAGIVSHKLISDSANQFQFAEAAEDENLQSTFNLMDAYAESVIAGYRDIEDLDKVAGAITKTGDAGNLWAGSGWTQPQKDMVQNRLEVLRSYIQSVKTEQARSLYVSPIRGM